MAETTHIEWTGATWNPITGCSIHSPGCTNCYAMKLAGTRLRNHPSRAGLTQMTKAGSVWTGEVRLNAQWLDQPLSWTRPRDIFVCAHADLFHHSVPDGWIDMTVAVMILGHQHRYQVLTKRPDRMAAYWSAPDLYDRILNAAREYRARRPYLVSVPIDDPRSGNWHRNIWLGVSVEDQTRADERRQPLADLAGKGWNTWVSYEPAIGPVDWAGWGFIRWLVSGGESGRGARPSHPQWHRLARDYCQENAIAYFFKQHGSWKHMPERAHFKELAREPWRRVESMLLGVRPALMFDVGKKEAGAMLDGREWREFPNA